MLSAVKIFIIATILSIASRLPVWKKLPADPLFSSGYGYDVAVTDD